MKPFRFRLDPVLDLRARREEEEARKLSHAQRAVAAARAHREALEQALASGEAAMALGSERRSVGTVRQSIAILEEVRRCVNEALAREANADRELSEQARAFRSAYQGRETLSRLRDRREDAWVTESARQEQIQLDEAGRSLHYLAALREQEG